MGKKPKEERIYVYVWLIHFAVQQKLTQYSKATILQKKEEESIGMEKIYHIITNQKKVRIAILI